MSDEELKLQLLAMAGGDTEAAQKMLEWLRSDEKDKQAVREVNAYVSGRADGYEQAIASLASPAPVEAEPAALAEVEIPEGFVKWEGGECPVADGEEFAVLQRDGSIVNHDRYCTPCLNYNWQHIGNPTDIIAYRVLPIEPAAEAKGEEFDDGEAMRMAHSIMPGSGATFKTDEEIRESVRPHASDCARNNEPAYPAGKCDCTLRLKWTRYSEIAPKSPDELTGYEVQSHYSDEHGEWIYRHVPKAVGAGVDPFTIAASEQHAEESARAQDLAPLFPPEPPQPATPESLRAGGIVDSEASYWAGKLTTAQAGHVRKGWTL